MPVDPKKVAGTFCPSPWIHVKLASNGRFHPCRWASPHEEVPSKITSIYDSSVIQFFNSDEMNSVREKLLNAEPLSMCSTCLYEDSFDKISGRQRQLFRFGLDGQTGDRWLNNDKVAPFEYSSENSGKTYTSPYDFQIELGPICNLSCIMCGPRHSLRLERDYKALHPSNPTMFPLPPAKKVWSMDAAATRRLIDSLNEIEYVEYLHFMGGEPFFSETFYTICEAMIKSGKSKSIFLSATTNGTVWNERLENIVREFKMTYFGVSIDANRSLNDYMRFPSKLDVCVDSLDRMIAFSKTVDDRLFVLLRTTQSIFTVYYLDEMVDFAMSRNLTWENSAVLVKPTLLRVELLPEDLRQIAISKLYAAAERNGLENPKAPVVDTRNVHSKKLVMSDTVFTMIRFLENYQVPENVDSERRNLVQFITSFEGLHTNKILDHAPEFESFLRKYGYEG